MPLPGKTTTDSHSQDEAAVHETAEALSDLELGAEAELEEPLTGKRTWESLGAAEASEASEPRKRAQASRQTAEAASATPSSAEELESSSGSIEANIKANLETLRKYLRYSDRIYDQCVSLDIFSDKEELEAIHNEPGESTRGVKCLDILLTKEEPVLERFVEALKEAECEQLVPLFKNPLTKNPALKLKLDAAARYEAVIRQPEHKLNLIRVIDSRMQKEELVTLFVHKLQQAGVIKVDERWDVFVQRFSRPHRAAVVVDKLEEQFGLGRGIEYLLEDPELEEDERESLLAIQDLATKKVLADSPAPLEASPPSKVTRERILAIFSELVRCINLRPKGLIGCCSGDIFSKAELERIEAKRSSSNRTRAYLLALLEANQLAKFQAFARVLGMLGYRALALCLNGDSEMIDKLRLQRRYKESANQRYPELVESAALLLQVGSGWSLGACDGLLSFREELEKMGIVKPSESWELEERAKLSPCELFDRLIAESEEQLGLPELIGLLKRKWEEQLGKDTQSPPDANLVEGIKVVSRIINQVELAEAPPLSDTLSSEEDMSGDMFLLQKILDQVKRAADGPKAVALEKKAALQSAQRDIDRAAGKLKQVKQRGSSAEEVTAAEKALAEAMESKKKLKKMYREREILADKHIVESVRIFRKIDREYSFDRYVERSDLPPKAFQDLLLREWKVSSAFASMLIETVKSEKELRILCDVFRKSGQMKVIKASQDPTREASREAACEELNSKHKRRGLVEAMRPDRSFLDKLRSVGLITECDYQMLLDDEERGYGREGEILKVIDQRCGDDVIQKLETCLISDCQLLAASHLVHPKYKDEKAERFNKNWGRLPSGAVIPGGGIDYSCYSKILEAFVRSRTVSLRCAEESITNAATESNRDRVIRLKWLFSKFNAKQIRDGLLAINAFFPELIPIIETEDIRISDQADQCSTQSGSISKVSWFAPPSATAETTQAEVSSEEGPEKEVYTLSKT